MSFQLNLQEFKVKNNISNQTWDESGCSWEELCEIAKDYLTKQRLLEETGQFFANVIQTFAAVHSVRWRVKDVEHVLEKIIRKRSKKEKKYANISSKNYFSIITDLIGIRALHLFKDEYLSIDENVRSSWQPEETPVVYLRQGDVPPSRELCKSRGFKIKHHPAGYRSVHYVVSSNVLKTKIFAEIQVRTIFEEGWSEIDHRVRYPNHLDDELVAYFLRIFNRMAGSADEMGSFVKDLVSSVEESKRALDVLNQEKTDALAALDDSIKKLQQKEKTVASQDALEQVKQSVTRLKNVEREKVSASAISELSKMVILWLGDAQAKKLDHTTFHAETPQTNSPTEKTKLLTEKSRTAHPEKSAQSPNARDSAHENSKMPESQPNNPDDNLKKN
jgi:ppGpp synthetase/RelA/SpoT-type nucleotidyltranferase